MNWWILEVSLGINNVLCNDKRYKRGLDFLSLVHHENLEYTSTVLTICVLNIVTNLHRRQVQ